MEEPVKKEQRQKRIIETKTYTVPISLIEIKENISISTNTATNTSKNQIINQAFKFHSEGKLEEAAKYYQYFIDQGFNDQRVFSNYGIILQNLGNLEEAKLLLLKAIKVKPDYAEAHNNLGIILRDLGKLQDAELSTRRAIKLKSKYAEAHNNLGTILIRIGKKNKARLSILESIKLKPDYAEAHCNLGIILRDLGKLQDAELSTRRAIRINTSFAEAHNNLGTILKDLSKLQDAELSILKAIQLKPDYAEAYCNLAIILRDLDKLQDAELSTRKAIELKPDYAEAYYNLGTIMIDLGKLQEAELSTRKAIELKPDLAEAHLNLGNVLRDLGKLQAAELSFRKAIELKPDLVGAAWNLYGLANSIKEAEERINQCLKIDKNYLEAKLTLSALKLHQGDQSLFDNLIKSTHKDHPTTLSIKWVSTLPKLPELFFHRWALFDSMINKSKKDRPFYEFGVWRGVSFKYLINAFKKGYGFDTFEGIPEDWHNEKEGTYSAEGIIPKIDGGTFLKGKFEDTLPSFFKESRPIASIINFDADLYSSTLCALNYSKPVIDKNTILIFDEFIINKNWEQDEYKALNEFCSNNNLTYEVLAISYCTKQVAVKLIGV